MNEDERNDVSFYIHATVLILLSTTFTISLLITIYLAYICTTMVTTDVLVLKQRDMLHFQEEFVPIWDDNCEPIELFCSVCQAYVQIKTKHCGPCNRCCEEFDHHCKWLNNCIGTENYNLFRRLINFYLIFCLSSMFLFIQLLVKDIVNEISTGS